MSLELFNQLEQKITDTVEALEMMKLENEELRNENAQLKQEREEWERRLQGVQLAKNLWTKASMF